MRRRRARKRGSELKGSKHGGHPAKIDDCACREREKWPRSRCAARLIGGKPAIDQGLQAVRSRWGRQHTYRATKQRLHRPDSLEAVVPLPAGTDRLHRQPALDETADNLLRLVGVAAEEPSPVVQVAL